MQRTLDLAFSVTMLHFTTREAFEGLSWQTHQSLNKLVA